MGKNKGADVKPVAQLHFPDVVEKEQDETSGAENKNVCGESLGAQTYLSAEFPMLPAGVLTSGIFFSYLSFTSFSENNLCVCVCTCLTLWRR